MAELAEPCVRAGAFGGWWWNILGDVEPHVRRGCERRVNGFAGHVDGRVVSEREVLDEP